MILRGGWGFALRKQHAGGHRGGAVGNRDSDSRGWLAGVAADDKAAPGGGGSAAGRVAPQGARAVAQAPGDVVPFASRSAARTGMAQPRSPPTPPVNPDRTMGMRGVVARGMNVALCHSSRRLLRRTSSQNQRAGRLACPVPEWHTRSRRLLHRPRCEVDSAGGAVNTNAGTAIPPVPQIGRVEPPRVVRRAIAVRAAAGQHAKGGGRRCA